MFYFDGSGNQLDHAGKRPLYTCDWSCVDSCRHRISVEIGGRNTKTGSYSRLSLPFSFSHFSPLPLPFLHLSRSLFSLAFLFASILSCFFSCPGSFKTNSFYINHKMSTFEKHMVLTILHQERWKWSIQGLVTAFANISRMNLRETTYPSKWKVGKIGKGEVCANYQPLTLQGFPSKISPSVIC